MIFLHYLWVGPLQTIAVMVLLWKNIGPSCFAGFGVLLIMIPCQAYMGKLFSRLRAKTAVQTDERVRLMNEILSAMRVIKMYTWEKPFAELVRKVRGKEVQVVLHTNYLRSLNNALVYFSTPVMVYSIILPWLLTGNHLTPRIIFMLLLLLVTLRMSLVFHFAEGVKFTAEMLVSVRRVQTFLLLGELHKTVDSQDSNLRPKPADCTIVAKEIGAYWDQSLETPTLKNLSFEVKPGELLAVIGPVASGKSSLLMALLSDLEMLPQGDMTMVGEKGVTLSGGQKARVNLARAIYSDADVYLLDDPLSAVDAAVGRHLFNKCIKTYLSSKPCILVTHQLQYLQAADKILILKEGEMADIGTFNELLDKGVDFAKLLKRDDDEEEKKRPLSISSSSECRLAVSKSKSNLTSSKMSLSSLTSDFMPEEPVAKMQEEERRTSTIGWRIYVEYFKAGGGALVFAVLLIINLFTQTVFVMSDWWLSVWANTEESNYAAEEAAFNSLNSTNETDIFIYSNEDRDRYIYIYTALVLTVVIMGLIRAFLFYRVCVIASKNLHNSMFSSIIRAPILFFDTNPVGRILNRFSRDIGFMDDLLPWCFFDFVQCALLSLGIVIVAGVINPWVFIPTVPLALLFLYLRHYFLSTSRNIKRLDGVTRSPVYSHLSASLQGLWTIRAFKAEDIFIREFNAHQDLHTEAWFLHLTGSRWFSIRLDLLCACFVTTVSFSSVLAAENLNAGLVGLSLAYAITLMGVFQWCVRQSAEVENQMTAVERVYDYTQLAPEAALHNHCKPEPEWPKHGIITMETMSFKYSEDSPTVLKNIYLCIRAKEKVGIVGRTGAGKSSLISSIYRLAEPSGTIKIDGVDISSLGLHDLRSKVSIIPQDPMLFTGPLRKNLDPFTEHSDAELWQSLEQVQLKSAVEDLVGGLEAELADSGSNLSVGQRQLVCLARAILLNNRILIMDEATANVDPRTDALIQETIRNRFQHCTVLTIAHRLNTVMDSDRILVMSNGRVAEFDEPHLLLQNPLGELSRMVEQTGRSEADQLHQVAEEAYNVRHPVSTLWISDAKRSFLSSYIPTDVDILEIETVL
ncbi:ATP-binding cassette sub-family C member 4-like [Saccoglossus kowalevskii]